MDLTYKCSDCEYYNADKCRCDLYDVDAPLTGVCYNW